MAFHGIVSTREDVGVQPIPLIGQSIIGLVGTAPAADVDGTFGDGTNIKYNEVFKIDNRNQASSALLGTTGTLPIALNGIYRQGQATVQMVIVEAGTARTAVAAQTIAVQEFYAETDWEAFETYSTTDTIWAVVDDAGDGNKYLAFKNLTAADVTAFGALGVGQEITVTASGATDPTHTYTVRASYDTTNVRIQINQGASTTSLTGGTDYTLAGLALTAKTAEQITLENMIGGEADGTGVYALLSADPKPKLFCTGFEGATKRFGGNANGLASALVTVAERNRGVAILSGPGTSDGAAMNFAGDFDSDVGAAYMVEPWIVTNDGTVTADPSVAGKIAVTDGQDGFWSSPSNMVINGALGLNRQISHGFDGSQSDLLNEDYIAALVRDGGITLWGNETLSPTSATYRFINVARTANAIQDSLDDALKWAIARNITVRLLDQIAQSVNLFLDNLTAQGAITGGLCYPDAEKNNVSTVKEGQVFFNVEWSAVYPLQTLNLSLQLSDRFLEAVLEELGT